MLLGRVAIVEEPDRGPDEAKHREGEKRHAPAVAIAEAGLALTLDPIQKWDFYAAVETPDHVLTIQTADQQRFANVLLSVGVRMD